MFPFVEYLLLGIAAIALIMGVLVASMITRVRSARRELERLESSR